MDNDVRFFIEECDSLQVTIERTLQCPLERI